MIVRAAPLWYTMPMITWINRARWATDRYILLMLGVFPLFWGNDGYNNITKSKFLFFAIATGVWLVSLLVLLTAGLLRGERYDIKLRPVHWAMLAFLSVGAVSAILSPYGGESLLGAGRYDGFLTMTLLCAMFFGVSALARPRRLYVWALAFSVSVCAVVSFVQGTGVNFLGLYPDGTNYFDNYIVFNGAFLGTLGNAGITCAFLCFAAPVLIVTALKSPEKRDRWLLLPSAMALVNLVLCGVDAGYAALLACALVSVPLLPGRKKTRRALLWAVGAVVALGLVLVWFWPGQSGMFWELSRILHGDVRIEFGSHRIEIWQNALEAAREHTLLGTGPGTAAKRLDVTWTRYIEETGQTRVSGVDNTHNVYLGYLLSVGVLGLLAYLAAMVCSFITWLRRRDDALFAALGAGVLCYLAQDFFGLGLVISSPFLWLGGGLLEAGGKRG